MSRAERLYHRTVTGLLLLILLLPLAATLIYALPPSGCHYFAGRFYPEVASGAVERPALLQALWHSLLICFGTLLLSVVVILPAMFVIAYYFPKLDAVMNVLILLPFAVPPVVSAVGLMQLFAADPLPLLGTPWILVGCYFTIALPFIYRAISNNMQAINLRDLMDAAHLLGASTAGGAAGGAAEPAQGRNDRRAAVVLVPDRRVRVRQPAGGQPV